MKMLDPAVNIKSITSLVQNAQQFVVFVSPYSDLEGWDDLKDAINEASGRGVPVSYYVREKEGLDGLEGLNVKVHEVPLLHAKMFLSESEAIMSSFHLMNNPDLNWACKLETQDEYNELYHFFEAYIKQEDEQAKEAY